MTYVITDSDRLRLLGLNPDNHPTADDIRRAYRRLALRHHPDRGGDPAVFGAVADAYRVLTGGEPARFDAYGEPGADTRPDDPEPGDAASSAAGSGSAGSGSGSWSQWEQADRSRTAPPPGWFSDPVDARPDGVKARRRWVDRVGWTIHRPARTVAICVAVAAAAGLLLAARSVIDPAGLVEPLPGEPFRLRFPLPVAAVIALLVGAGGPAGLSWAMSGPGRRKWIAAAVALLWLEGLIAGGAVVVCFLAVRGSRHRFWLTVAAVAAVIWIGFWPALWLGAALTLAGDWFNRRRRR